jgi:hypothetical protein
MAILPNYGVRKNFNPRNITYIPAVRIFSFPRSKSGTLGLYLNKISYSWTETNYIEGGIMDTITTRVFSGCRVLYISAVFVLVISLAACAGGPQTKEEEPAEVTKEEEPAEVTKEEEPAEVTKEEEPDKGKGSLARTFTIVDELGRNSGTLTIDPLKGVILRDENGSVIGKFKPELPDEAQPVKVQPAVVQPAVAQPAEAQPTEVQPTEIQPAETQTVEAQPAEVQQTEVQPETPITQ